MTGCQRDGIDRALADEITRTEMRDLAKKPREPDDAERLAALGELTAGVAHEIKNPLNFINNFAHVSLDLMDEAMEALTPAMVHLDAKTEAEISDLLSLVRQNFVKINQHGRRADSIVRTMLMHARQRPDKTQIAPLNALVEEAIALARQDFQFEPSGRPVKVTSSLCPSIDTIECFPEDLVRALINLVGNGIDAAQRNEEQAVPVLKVATEAMDDKVEITIEDNGIGMPDNVLDQAFTPFFTTKPPGEGTGLGLSLSHDVISRQHRGQIAIVSEPGKFTRVTVTLFEHLPERRNGGRRRDDG